MASIAAVIYMLSHNMVSLNTGNSSSGELLYSIRPDVAQLSQILPVASGEKYEGTNGKTVYFIPQTHKNPGSRSADRLNDSAEKAQREIYSIIEHLSAQYGIRHMMVEGEIYGPVPQNEINTVRYMIERNDALISHYESIRSAAGAHSTDAQLEKSLISRLGEYSSALEREIFLKGAPYRLSILRPEVELYGAEDPDTFRQSADIVREYIYVTDRIKKLTKISPQKISGLASLPPTANMTGAGPSLSVTANLLRRKALLYGNEALATAVGGLLETLGNNVVLKTNNSSSKFSSGAVSDPYRNVYDISELKRQLRRTETAIRNIVIDRRNSDTVRNYKRSLADNGVSEGILVFGAGHTKGLVDEFRAEGFTVYVITPSEVAANDK